MLLLASAVLVAAAIVITFAAAGRDEAQAASVEQPTVDASAAAAAYRDLRDRRRGPNAGMYRGKVAGLTERLPRELDTVETSDVERAAALAKRPTQRPYDRAPPTIPHAAMQRAHDCVACHAEGAVIAGKTAPRMSHGPYPSCTQCHVPAADPRPIETPPPLAENDFVGLVGPGRGERAWLGAPPTIPHSTRMREECSSCHGVSGKAGLRTAHPHQTSCTQCHAPSAALDQRASKSLSR